MAKLLLCFKPMRDEYSRSAFSNGHVLTDGGSLGTLDSSTHTVAYVELLKQSSEPLGLVLQGGKDLGVLVQVEAIRPGGVAAKSGALQPGDRILGINGVSTQHLTQSEVNRLLETAGNVINLEIAFEAPPGPTNDDNTVKKTAIINLPRESNKSNSYGFTISGGQTENRPITVSNVTLNTTAYRLNTLSSISSVRVPIIAVCSELLKETLIELGCSDYLKRAALAARKNGFLKAGDHILKVNGVNVSNASQKDTFDLIKSSGDTCNLEIQYDVPVHNILGFARGPMLVELLKPRGVSLGISLRLSPEEGGGLRISRIKEAGIADRCGALHVGDAIVSLNGQSLAGKSVQEAYQILKYSSLNMQLEIRPAGNQSFEEDTFEDTASTVSRLPSFSSRLFRRPSQLSISSMATSTQLSSHPESMLVNLTADEVGFGLSLQGGATEFADYPISISSIEDGGPAARLGQLQVGDRVLAINGETVEGCTIHQAVKLVKEAGQTIELEIMFDVQDAVVPTAGTFEVNLVKTASLNFGITINGSIHTGDQIWISRLKKGGIAYRTGMLNCGDILLGINGISLEHVNLNQAAEMLKSSGERVALKVSKENVPVSETVVFSVELHRNHQSLGITLTGNRDSPGHPVIISRIKEDGVAYLTGTLNVGDSILAINGQSLASATLPDAVHMLSTAGEVVLLKICKAASRARRGRGSPLRKMFHRTSNSRGSGRRTEGQESYSRLLALRARRYSQSTIATTISGRSTPDNHSVDGSSFNGSFYAQPFDHTGRDSVMSQLTPSEYGSAFSRPTSALSGRYRFNGPSQNISDVGYLFAPQLPSSLELRQRLRNHTSSLFSPVKENRFETDEELSQYTTEDKSLTRRQSLPQYHRQGSIKWDFKRRQGSTRKPPRLIGRVSPLTPSDPPDLTSAPPYQGAGKVIPPSPVKENPIKDSSDDYEDDTQEGAPVNAKGPTEAEAVTDEMQRPDSKLSSAGSNSVDTEQPEFVSTSISGAESQSTTGSPEPPTQSSSSQLPCSTPVPQTTHQAINTAQADSLPGYEEHTHVSGASPTNTKVLKTPPLEHTSTNNWTEKAMSKSSTHQAEMLNGASLSSPSQSKLHIKTELPRRTSAPDIFVAMKPKHSNISEPKSKSASSFDPSAMQEDYRRTIHKATEFEKAMRALAESGSSDQDSDSEPHGNKPEAMTTNDLDKITKKMRATNPNSQLKICHVVMKRMPGTSYGFSLADGCYDPGVYVKAVKDGSPADKAGLLPFDILLKIDDTLLQPAEEFTCKKLNPLLKQCKDHLELKVARQQQQLQAPGESHC